MHNIHLRSIDLNLLVILNALLDEQNVTRAAASLYLTQSATSHALSRLRSLFNDPLLERQGSTMVLTPFAETLREPLQALMSNLHNLLSPDEITLYEIKQNVHIALADYPAAIMLPHLWPRLQKIAPGINVIAHNWRDGNSEIERLRRGDIGLAISTFGNLPSDICRTLVGEETYVGVAAPDHPISAAPDIEEWMRYPHIIVSSTGARATPIDDYLDKLGFHRQVGLSVPGFLSVPSIIGASDAVALIPRSIAGHWPQAEHLRQFTVPIETGSFNVDLAWHKRRENDVAIQTVARLLSAVASELLTND